MYNRSKKTKKVQVHMMQNVCPFPGVTFGSFCEDIAFSIYLNISRGFFHCKYLKKIVMVKFIINLHVIRQYFEYCTIHPL